MILKRQKISTYFCTNTYAMKMMKAEEQKNCCLTFASRNAYNCEIILYVYKYFHLWIGHYILLTEYTSYWGF